MSQRLLAHLQSPLNAKGSHYSLPGPLDRKAESMGYATRIYSKLDCEHMWKANDWKLM